MFAIRKITRAKWQSEQLSANKIPADAVTADLRTQQNSLSLWQCPADTDDDIGDAVLAIAAGRDRIDRIDVVWLDVEDLETDGQTLIHSKGRTPVTDMIDMHIDASRLDYILLGKIADRVANAIESGRYRRFTRARVRKLIATARERGRISDGELGGSILDEISG